MILKPARHLLISFFAVLCTPGAAIEADIPMVQARQHIALNQIHQNVLELPRHFDHNAPLSALSIRRAIDNGCRYLREGLARSQDSGQNAMAILALLAAGADPLSDEFLRKNLEQLATREDDNTYFRAVRANVWEYALRKVPWETTWKDALKKDYTWLVEALGSKEGWRYSKSSTDWDNSVTQYGMLGIWAAARAGIDPGAAFWQKMSQHWRSSHTKDGGWLYTGGEGSTGGTPNMATAGLASLFLVLDMHHGKTCWRSGTPDPFASGEAAQCLSAINRGLSWLEKNSAHGWNDGYFLYGIERTGVAGGRRLLGGIDWFRRGATQTLQAQHPNGAFALSGHGGPLATSAFAVLFLVYGGAPVAFDKLDYGDEQGWNPNPRDLANLCRNLWSAYERPINWHSVPISADVADFEAPILFISGTRAPRVSDKELATLREYILRGGTIFAEGADHSATFTSAMETLLARLFPVTEYPSCALAPLPPEHGIYTVLKHDWTKRPTLRGAGDGSRTFFFLSDDYLAGDWQQAKEDSDAFKIGMNLLFYATDSAQLSGRFSNALPAIPAAPPRSATLTVARIQPSTCSNRFQWQADAACWRQAAPYLEHTVGCKVQERSPVVLGKDPLEGLRLLHLSGMTDFQFTADERTALRTFIDSGGTILIDTHAGVPAFASAARKEIESIFGKLTPLSPRSLFTTGSFLGGNDLTHGLQLNLEARKLLRNTTTDAIPLETIMIGQRPAVLFSRFDLASPLADIAIYHASAWKPESAKRIIANLAAWITAQ
jgi:hypothetical protein